jgi:hypothetical protein
MSLFQLYHQESVEKLSLFGNRIESELNDELLPLHFSPKLFWLDELKCNFVPSPWISESFSSTSLKEFQALSIVHESLHDLVLSCGRFLPWESSKSLIDSIDLLRARQSFVDIQRLFDSFAQLNAIAVQLGSIQEKDVEELQGLEGACNSFILSYLDRLKTCLSTPGSVLSSYGIVCSVFVLKVFRFWLDSKEDLLGKLLLVESCIGYTKGMVQVCAFIQEVFPEEIQES